jgi:hypothetical protein
VKNRFLLVKCITLGAFTFPTPFLVLFYLNMIYPEPNDYIARFIVVIFLILSGGLIGVVFYYRDSAMAAIKDWFPSEHES